MKNFLVKNILVLIVLVLPLSAQSESRALEGSWLGTLEVNGIKMRFVLKITKASDGYAALFDSPDQGAKDLPIDLITLAGHKMSFIAKRFGINYEGTLNEKGNEINGTFRQGAGSTPFVFNRISDVPKTIRPQDPQKPYPYQEEEVTYHNPKDNIKLAGTLTLPASGGKHPAVILITGSGGQDRDETVAGHRPFLVLSDHLTRKGIAVLRVDDRGLGGSGGGSLEETGEDFAGDVLAGIEYLKSRKEIDPKKIGLIGHSEGGMIAPMVSVRSKDVAFIVLLAGLGQTGEDVIYTQTGLIQKAQGVNPEITAQTIRLIKKINEILKSETDRELAGQRLNEALAKQKSEMTEDQRKAFAPVETVISSQMPMYLSAWFRYFITFDPQPVLEKVKIPVLALNGENDLQVAWKENLDLISAALKKGKNPDFTVKSFPHLNHLFQTSRTGLMKEYSEIEETMSPAVLETVSNWILERTIRK